MEAINNHNPNDKFETKSDGLQYGQWVIKLLDEALSFGYKVDIEVNGKKLFDFYNDDYSAEDAWREIFENMVDTSLFD